jgi:hypothetical protein
MQTHNRRRGRRSWCQITVSAWKLNLEAPGRGHGAEQHDDAEPVGAVRVGRVHDGAGRDHHDVPFPDAERLPLPLVEQDHDALALADVHDLVGVVVAGLQERARRRLEHRDAVPAHARLQQLVGEALQHLELALPRAHPVPEALVAEVVRPAGAAAPFPFIFLYIPVDVRVRRERDR